jgi:hypothetical protein
MLSAMGGRSAPRRLVGAAVLTALAALAPAAAAAPGSCSGPGTRAVDCPQPGVRALSAAAREARAAHLAGRRAALAAAGRRAQPLAGGALVADPRRPLAFHAPDGYLFTVRRGAEAALRRAGARPVYPEIGVWHVPARSGPALRARLLQRGLLRDTAVDRKLRLHAVAAADPLVATEWWKDAIDADGLDLPSPRKKLMIVDTGLARSHPEFAGRPNTVLENRQDVKLADGSGADHGTRVASIAAAAANGQGFSGVFPTVRLGIWDGGNDGVSTSTELAAFRRAVARGYSVVNMSFGSNLDGRRFRDPAQRAEALGIARAYARGVLFVAAAGNEFEDGNPFEAPAGTPHVFTAAASTQDDRHAEFSNAQPYNDVAAPGEELVLARPAAFGARFGPCETTNQWCQTQGTSFSSPLVAGAAALVWSARPGLSVDQLANVLRSSARDVGPAGYDNEFGYGILSVRGALEEAAQPADPGEPNEDTALVNGEVFGRADPFLLGPRPRRALRKLTASIDAIEDPADLYRIALPARSRVTVSLRPLDDDVDLTIWNATVSGTGFYDRADQAPLRRKRLRGLRIERVTLRGPATGRRVAYVQVTAGKGRVGGVYELTISRR